MSSPAPSILSARDICSIIKAGFQYSVAKLTFGPLHIEFEAHSAALRQLDKPSEALEAPQEESPSTAPIAGPMVFDKTLLDELEMNQRLIDDPEAFEIAAIDAQIHGNRAVNEQATDYRRSEQDLSRG